MKRDRTYKHTWLQLILVMLFTYPMLFSFSHVLIHHPNKPHQSTYCCAHEEEHAGDSGFHSPDEVCPVLKYQVSLALKPGFSQLQGAILTQKVFNFPLDNCTYTSSYFSSRSSRAPPVFV